MMVMSQGRTDIVNQTDEQRVARERMALFPSQAEVLFTSSEIWVVSKVVLIVLCCRTERVFSLWYDFKGSFACFQASRDCSRGC